jgi:hypothetical protein
VTQSSDEHKMISLGPIATKGHNSDLPISFTSNSDITTMIKNAKDLVTKEKTGKFKPRRQNDQLSVALETKEHQGHTQAISSIAS